MFLKKKKLKSGEAADSVNLEKYRTKKWKKWWWLIAIAIIILAVVAWYVIGLVRAYKAATVKNTNTNSSTVLKNASENNGPTEPINILLIGIEGGTYPGAELSDSIEIASIDPQTKTISLLSVPRDLVVNIPGYGRDKINAAHSDAELNAKNGEKGAGPALLRQVITNTFGIPIHYFVRLDFDGFRQIIDAIGGVDVTVKTAVYDPFFPNGTGGYTTFSISTGPHHLDGPTALKYARSRETSTDFARSARQQEIISSVKDKLVTPEVLANPKKTSDLIAIAGNHILTDFSASDLNEAVALANQMKNPTVRTQVIDNSPKLGLLQDGTSAAGAYILTPVLGPDNYRGLEAFAQGYFATPRIAKEATTIELKNGGVRSDVMTRLQQQLEWAGFTVSVSPTTTTVTKSTLVDYSAKTPNSLTFLKNAYGITATQTTPPDGISTNLQLTVGPDWTDIEKAAAKKVVGSVDSPLKVE